MNPSTTPIRPQAGGDAADPEFGRPLSGWRLRMYIVIFEADTRAGRRFDLWLIAAVLASVLVVLLDSVQDLHARWHRRIRQRLYRAPDGKRARQGRFDVWHRRV